jgi:hypothetical protein
LPVSKMATVVASTLPPEPLVPVAAIHVPVLTSLSLTETVAVITVLELKLTVVCPLSALCTSRVSPAIVAIVPDAAGLNAAGRPPGLLELPPAEPPPAELLPPELPAWAPVPAELEGAVRAADALLDELVAAALLLPPPPPQAAATREITATVPTARARRLLRPAGILSFFTGV